METTAPAPIASPASTIVRGGFVLLALAATTALALLAVYFLEHAGLNLMGYYVALVVPAGAILAGILAASGFGLATWATARKLDGRLFAVVVILLAAGYFLANYLEFRLSYPNGVVADDGTPLGFWRFFDFSTRAIHLESSGPLGLFGYGFRLFELVGFAAGGPIAVAAALSSLPTCRACRSYKRSREVAYLPRDGQEPARAILEAAARGDGPLAAQLLAQHHVRSARRQTDYIELLLVYCMRCKQGDLIATFLGRRGIVREKVGAQPLEANVVAHIAPGA